MLKFKFNHESDSLQESLGIDESQVKGVFRKMSEIMHEAKGKTSEVVEGIYNNFTKEEASFIVGMFMTDMLDFRAIKVSPDMSREDIEKLKMAHKKGAFPSEEVEKLPPNIRAEFVEEERKRVIKNMLFNR